MSDQPTPCRFGYEEHDGHRYCFEHGGFWHYVQRPQRCDESLRADGRPTCACGFVGDARKRTQTEHITTAVLEAFDHD